MRIYLLIICACFVAGKPEARELTLKQALQLAEVHSHTLKKAQAASGAAGESLKAAHAEQRPTLSVMGLAAYIDDVPTLDIDFPSGQSLARDIGTSDNYQIDLRLSLPIYTGGRTGAVVDAAEATLDHYRSLQRGSRDQVRYRTRVEYLGLVRADRLVAAADASLERTKIAAADIEAMFGAGVADSVDLLEASLALTRAVFERDRALSGRRSVEIRLLTLLGLEASEKLILTSKLPQPVLPPAVSKIADSKPELEAAAAAIRLKESRVRFATADYLPSVSTYAGYSYGKPNLDRFNNTWNDYLTVGAQLTWSFNTGGREFAARSAARYNLRASIHQREQLYERLDRDAEIAYEHLKQAYRKYLSAEDEFRSTSDNYRLASKKHREGSLSANRLLEIQTTLSSAEANLAAALVDFYIAQSTWLYAIGSNKLAEEM